MTVYNRELRRERRAQKRAEWKAANPLLVGVRAKPGRQISTAGLKRGNHTPAGIKSIASKAATQVKEYRNQIIRATYLYNHEFRRVPLLEGGVCLPEVAIFSAGYRKNAGILESGESTAKH